MDPFVDTTLTSDPSNDTLDENSSIEKILECYDRGGTPGGGGASCVIA
jgi:hypothetical protein